MNKLFTFALVCITFLSFSQKKAPENWQLLNPKSDKVYGMGVEESYKLLEGKKAKQVIVAVIDSGIEIDHDDLKDVIWTNTGEIPNNGIDDDKNGYIDDVHGWSFIGGDSLDINDETMELSRMYYTMNAKFEGVSADSLSPSDQAELLAFDKIKTDFLKEKAIKKQQLMGYKMLLKMIKSVKNSNNGIFNKKTLKKYKPADALEKSLKKRLKLVLLLGVSANELEEEVASAIEDVTTSFKINSGNFDSIRRVIVGDDPTNFTNRYYGCNRVEGPDARHGTHVAGIIAASRNNGIGLNGVASNVLIMPIRAVPNGDERDKDIANAIYYAVDNGATIINMSFGKYYSPNQGLIDAAVKYAAAKDVLLINAAGNEAKNNDIDFSFPTRNLLNGTVASNWIQVGANSFKPGKKLIGSFSNYGLNSVDLFAPGVDIYSSVTDNTYAKFSGTSMAAPATAGVAAIIRGYFPELSAQEVRAVLMRSVAHYKRGVKIPGVKRGKKKVAELCISGGFVNANNAVTELLGLN